MAKGDICKVEGCEKIITAIGRTICSMHKARMKKYKSYDLPIINPKILPEGIIKECKVHGNLKREDCIIHTKAK